MGRLRTRGKFLKKEEWYSICSRHIEYDENCQACNKGGWYNIYKSKLSGVLYDISPKFWIWINN